MFRWVPTPKVMAIAAAALLGVGGLTTGLLLATESSPSHHAVVAAPAAPAPAVRAAPAADPGPPAFLIATLSGPVQYRATPGGTAAGTLPAQNPFGAPQVLGVIGTQGDGAGEWLHVQLPIRPNGSTGWIPASAASLTKTYYQVSVDLAARSLTVTDAGRTVLTTAVAVGTPATPTPPDHTYLWELIKPTDPHGAYGPYIFGLAEYSDAYSVFNGGDAQIGIHGQDEPWSIGQAASHGCVRLPNDVITQLAGMLPLGTPVTIS